MSKGGGGLFRSLHQGEWNTYPGACIWPENSKERNIFQHIENNSFSIFQHIENNSFPLTHLTTQTYRVRI
jgi:hypothetical protein